MKKSLSLLICGLLLTACVSPPSKAPELPSSEPPENLSGVMPLSGGEGGDRSDLQNVAGGDELPPTMESSRPAPTFRMAAPAARRALVGKWYGIASANDGGSKEWLIERMNDGTYRLDFRFTDANGEVSSQAEVGFWGVSGDIYFRIFRGWVRPHGMKPADPTDPDHYDAYEVLALTQNYFRYRHLDLSEIYTVKKMSRSFQLPVVASREQSEPIKYEY